MRYTDYYNERLHGVPLTKVNTDLDTLIKKVGFGSQVCGIKPLPGESNHTFRIDTPAGSWAFRLPGKGSSSMINRTHERGNHLKAAEKGLTPPFLHYDTLSGDMVLPFLTNAKPLTVIIARDTLTIKRVGKLLGKLHRMTNSFQGMSSVDVLNIRYKQLLRDSGTPLPEAYAESERHFLAALAVVQKSPWPLAPSHNDVTLGNLLLDPSLTAPKLWLIDWEYAGMNSPAWDLATYSLEARLNDEELRLLLDAWGGASPRPETMHRIRLFEQMIGHIWALWSLIRQTKREKGIPFTQHAFGPKRSQSNGEN